MGSIFEDSCCRNGTDPFGQQVAYRSAFFNARRKVVRVTGKASRRLSRDEDLERLIAAVEGIA